MKSSPFLLPAVVLALCLGPSGGSFAATLPAGSDALACGSEKKPSMRDQMTGSKATSQKEPAQKDNKRAVHYKNCAEARKAGVTPLRRGDPGYGRHLDPDGDGVACE